MGLRARGLLPERLRGRRPRARGDQEPRRPRAAALHPEGAPSGSLSLGSLRRAAARAGARSRVVGLEGQADRGRLYERRPRYLAGSHGALAGGGARGGPPPRPAPLPPPPRPPRPPAPPPARPRGARPRAPLAPR